MARIVFNADSGGAGDTILVAWLAEGLKAAGHHPVFHSTVPNRKLLLRVLNQEVVNEFADSIPLGKDFPAYKNVEITIDRGARSRAVVWADTLPDKPAAIRPAVKVPGTLRKWAAAQQAKDAQGKPVVAIFPFAHFMPRMWPTAYWVDLTQRLEDKGYRVWAMIESRHKAMLPHGIMRWWGHGWDSVAALTERASLVIGPDSGGAHLGATLNRPTLALMGPTSRIFDYADNVRELHTDKDLMPCVKCHFAADRGYRKACNTGCQSLMLLTPDRVFKAAMEMLNA